MPVNAPYGRGRARRAAVLPLPEEVWPSRPIRDTDLHLPIPGPGDRLVGSERAAAAAPARLARQGRCQALGRGSSCTSPRVLCKFCSTNQTRSAPRLPRWATQPASKTPCGSRRNGAASLRDVPPICPPPGSARTADTVSGGGPARPEPPTGTGVAATVRQRHLPEQWNSST